MARPLCGRLGAGPAGATPPPRIVWTSPLRRQRTYGLFGERGLPIAGVLRLLFAHHVDHLDPTKDRTSTVSALEPEHRSNSAFDGAMILLDAVIQVGTLSNANRLQIT